MKKSTLALLFLLVVSTAFSQAVTGKITGLKDAWGETITYIGEIKNKQPNGIGIAIYNNDYALRYAGNFLNGFYSGKGALVFKDGSFISGEWKNGKLNGRGANLDKDKDLYIGSFADGKKEGKGLFVYNDNAILQGEMKADQYSGRCIFIPAGAGTLSDNIYVAGKKDGLGYQYELETKKLFEGKWKAGDWQNATTDNYYSFLKDNDFYAEKTDDQIMIGTLNKTTNLLIDTAFYYDLKKKKRYFGFFKEGLLETGIIVRDDSSAFIGSVDDDGAFGLGSFYKVGKYYDEGNYVKDYMNGSNCLSIDLKDKSVYYGQTSGQGEFTGKAWFSNKSNELYSGDYKNGKFTGNGYKINAEGYCIKGAWNNGDPITVTAVTDDKGLPVSLTPKTLAEAITLVVKQSKTDLDILMGKSNYDDLDLDSYALKYESIFNFPGGLNKDYVLDDEDFNVNYVATYLETSDFAKAKAKYIELCKQLAAIKITLNKTDTPFGLTGTPNEPDEDESNNACSFLFPDNANIAGSYAASVLMVKDDDDQYKVQIVIGDDDAAILTGDYD